VRDKRKTKNKRAISLDNGRRRRILMDAGKYLRQKTA
jgi:hypothetical protein